MASKQQFEIETEPLPGDDLARIAVRAQGTALTHLLRAGDKKATDFLIAPPELLAHWIAGNWWRLRWEPIPADLITPDWRLAHDLRSVGGGYVWPNCFIWGQDSRIGISARQDPIGIVGPVRFLTNLLRSLNASEFETGVDRFLDEMLTRNSASGGLGDTVAALRGERQNPELSVWRRLEARLGYDPDDAPEELMDRMGQLAQQYGEANIEEAASATPGVTSAEVLTEEINLAKGGGGWPCDFSTIADLLPNEQIDQNEVPWKQGEAVAEKLRTKLGLAGPLTDSQFSDLLKLERDAIARVPSQKPQYGIRIRTAKGDRVLARSKWREGRRFEFARALGDFIVVGAGAASHDSVGPIASSKTARQKFQRTFAQHLLCPFNDLMKYMATSEPESEDIDAAAKHFDVSTWLIETTLVNHGVIGHEEFDQLVESL